MSRFRHLVCSLFVVVAVIRPVHAVGDESRDGAPEVLLGMSTALSGPAARCGCR